MPGVKVLIQVFDATTSQCLRKTKCTISDLVSVSSMFVGEVLYGYKLMFPIPSRANIPISDCTAEPKGSKKQQHH